LLDALSHTELLRRDAGALRSELEAINAGIETLMWGLAAELFGEDQPSGRDLVLARARRPPARVRKPAAVGRA